MTLLIHLAELCAAVILIPTLSAYTYQIAPERLGWLSGPVMSVAGPVAGFWVVAALIFWRVL